MPRYLARRTFPAALEPLAGAADAHTLGVIGVNALQGVTRVASSVTPEGWRSDCICDGPSPQAIRMAAQDSGLPVDRITEVRLQGPNH